MSSSRMVAMVVVMVSPTLARTGQRDPQAKARVALQLRRGVHLSALPRHATRAPVRRIAQ